MKFGLDFGTTNSSISINQGGKTRVIEVDQAALDQRVIRSMLYFLRREILYGSNVTPQQIQSQTFKVGDIQYQGRQELLIGQEAIESYLNDNKQRKPGIKRTIYTGRFRRMKDNPDQPRTDPVPEYYEEVDYGTGRLIQALKSSLRTSFKGTTIFGQFYSVEELIGMFVKKIKEKAEAENGLAIEEITIGRPVHFSLDPEVDQKAQNRLAVAMKTAGFKKLKFEYEPVAAAKQFLAASNQKQTIFVFDFGGGTLDTAIVRFGEKIEVLATDGVYIGGDLLNADIMQHTLWDYFGASSTWGEQKLQMPSYIYSALNSWYSIPSLNGPDVMNFLERAGYKNSNPKALERLIYLIKTNVGFEIYEAIEKAKKQLSEEKEARIIYDDGPINLDLKITRDEFEKIIAPRVEEIKEVVLKTLQMAKLEGSQIDMVVRTGGSSLIPVFEHILEDIFGKEKITLFETFTSIAAGLSLS
ncbi:Hsp70 family protein [Candidatus Daviesbacteria bacterium]|nr:Hsp70 family protein [Candidatus Daviesbacteria bacterium]